MNIEDKFCEKVDTSTVDARLIKTEFRKILYACYVHSLCLCFVGFSCVHVSCEIRKNPWTFIVDRRSYVWYYLLSSIPPPTDNYPSFKIGDV